MIDPAQDIEVEDMNELMPPGVVLPYAGASAPYGFLMCDGSAVSRATYADLFAVIGTSYGAGDGSTTFNVPDLRGRMAIGVGTGAKTINVSATAAAANALTVPSNRDLNTGQEVTYAGSGVTGLSAGNYYLIRVDATHVQFATSLANAIAGTAISISGTPSGVTLTLALTAVTAGETGGEEAHALTIAEMPSHTHATGNNTNTSGSGSGQHASDSAGGNNYASGVAPTGGSTRHNNLPPFLGLNFIIRHLEYHN